MSYIPLYEGLGITKNWAFDHDEKNPDLLLVGKQDAGTDYTLDRGASWKTMGSGDGYQADFEDVSGAYFFSSNFNINSVMGTSSSSFDPSPPSSITNNSFDDVWYISGNPDTNNTTVDFEVVNDYHNGKVYLGRRNLYSITKNSASTDEYISPTWELEADVHNARQAPMGQINAIALCPSDEHKMYLSSSSQYSSGYPPGTWGHSEPRLFRQYDGNCSELIDTRYARKAMGKLLVF